ncbi:response regulator transcription factor [Dehalococcoides mccartyi]|nr:response regulator transcription factor [Dehalococcoides mccartyi]
MEKPKILVIEDDRSLLEALRYNLVADGYEVRVAKDGISGLKAARSWVPNVIILDVLLPEMTGIEVSRKLREYGSTIPIVMLSAKATEDDRIRGLESGAVDYITKPFSIRELMARVAAQIRRIEFSHPALLSDDTETIDVGELSINRRSRVIKIRDTELILNLRESELLTFLALHPGRVHSREHLLNQVWEPEYSGSARTVDVHMRWLREKIEIDPSKPRLLHTVRGVGYRFDPYGHNTPASIVSKANDPS